MSVPFSALLAAAVALYPATDPVIPAGSETVARPPVFIPPIFSTGTSPASGQSGSDAPAGTGDTADQSDSGSGEGAAGGDEAPLPAGVNPTTTAAIVTTLTQARAFCRSLSQAEYVIDCLAERLDNASRRMAATSGYEDVRETLTEASRGLNRVARQNRTTARPAARFKGKIAGGPEVETDRRLVPVDPARMQAALAEAINVIDEAETLLLRSADNAEGRAAQFQRIASAIGSNKVLLRSL